MQIAMRVSGWRWMSGGFVGGSAEVPLATPLVVPLIEDEYEEGGGGMKLGALFQVRNSKVVG